MRDITKTVYLFNELNYEAKANAVAKWNESSNNNDWHECTISDIKGMLEKIGFFSPEVYFSLGYSQSDYVAIVGSYHYIAGSLAYVKQEFPEWEALHTFVQTLVDIQRPNFYKLLVRFDNRRSHSYVSNIMRSDDTNITSMEALERDFKDAIYQFEQAVYRMLRDEYEYTQSMEYVSETLIVNEYEFYSNGEMV